MGAQENAPTGSSGVAKVIDFGLARFSDELGRSEQDRTRHGELLGTLRYMSPEQCSGDPKRIDARSDIYGLGVVLYELVTGLLPYDLDGASILQIMDRIRTAPPRDPRAVGGGRLPGMESGTEIDGDLSAVLLRAVDKDPEERYASAGEMSADLGRWLAREPVHARRPTLVHRMRLFARRRRPLFFGLCAGAAAAAIALFVIAALFFDNRAKIREIRDQEAIAAAREEEVREARSLVAGLRDQFRGLDGSLIAGGIVDRARSATEQASDLPEQREAIEIALGQLKGLVALLGDDVEGARELADAFVEVGGLLGRAWSASAEESRGALEAYRSASALARSVRMKAPEDPEVTAWLGGILVNQAGACRKVGELDEGRACADEAVALARHGVRFNASVEALTSLLNALNERGDLHIEKPPFRQGLLDAQEALDLVDQLATRDVPERSLKDWRRWVLLRLGHWIKREGDGPLDGARCHREAREVSEWMLTDSLRSGDGHDDAWLLFHIFGWNEVGAYARLGDDAEVDRTIVELAEAARSAVAAGLGDAALVPATILSVV
ncbi:MAG: protein kinase, partial [Planctomycetota bacterium]